MRAAVVAAAAGLAGGAVGAGIVVGVDRGSGDDAVRTQTIVQQAPLSARRERGATTGLTPAEIYRRDAPGVVFVAAEVVQQTASPFDVFPSEQRGESTGTGFVVDADGSILTNAHVVENAVKVTVRFADQRTVAARVRGRDESTDLALLKVDRKGIDLRPLALGTSRDVRVGDPTVAIGNPFGLELTLTTGVISAKQRRIQAPDGFAIDDVLQTDAAINPGNSGGPLIDAAGRVIGINSQIRTGDQGGGSIGIGFAVPIDTARRILPQLEQRGRVERAYLGVTTATIDPSLNLRVDRGAFVRDVIPGGPADRGGVMPGDIVVRIGGRAVAGSDDIGAAVDPRRPGDAVAVELVRGGERKRVKVELGRRPQTLAQG